MAIPVIIHKSTAGSPPFLIGPKAGRFCDVGESSVAVITVENILSVAGTKNIVEAIVVEIPDADSTGPPLKMQTCLFGHVCEGAVAIVFV